MANKIQVRRDTAANWTSANPTLSNGEFGYETDTEKLKIGNGTDDWNTLAYNVGGDVVIADLISTDPSNAIVEGTDGKLLTNINFYNIKDYNVKGDGTNETSVIATALSIIPEGSTVFFPNGTYATNSSIVISKRLTILGNGYDTLFKVFTPETELGIHKGVITVSSDNVVIKNIRIDGNYTIASGGGAERNAGIYVSPNVKNTIIDNIVSYNLPRQGLCVVGENGSYTNIKVYDTARHNISVGDGSNVINVAKNNYFKNITCLGSEDAAFEINDGCENIYIDGFNFSGVFTESPLRIITHDRPNETNKNITFINGYINSNIGGVLVASASSTEKNESIKLINIDIVCVGIGIDVGNITNGLLIEKTSIDTPNTKIDIEGDASDVYMKDITIHNYVNGALIKAEGTALTRLSNINIDNLYFTGTWDSGNAQNVFNYIDGLSFKNTYINPTISSSGDVLQIQNTTNIVVNNLNASNYTSRNVFLGDCENILIDGCFFKDNNSHSIRANNCDNLTIRKTQIEGASENGIDTSNCTNITIDNSSITDCDYGVFSSGDTNYKIVNGTKIYVNNNASGVEFDNTNNISVSGVTINNNYRHGMRILGGSFVNVNNNQIYNNNTSNIGGSGIQLRTDNITINNIQFTSNNIYDDQSTTTQDAAIDYRLDSGVLNNIIITGNMLKDGIIGSVLTPSSTVIIDNNIDY